MTLSGIGSVLTVGCCHDTKALALYCWLLSWHCQALAVYLLLDAVMTLSGIGTVLLAAVMTLSGIGSVLTVGCCHDTKALALYCWLLSWHCQALAVYCWVLLWQCIVVAVRLLSGIGSVLLRQCTYCWLLSGIGSVLLGQCTYCWLLLGIGGVLLGAVMANSAQLLLWQTVQLLLRQTAQMLLRQMVHSCCGKTK